MLPSSPDVALITPFPPPEALHAGRSGVASYAANLAQALTDEGARVTVIAPREPGAPERWVDADLTVERPFERGAGALPAALAAARATRAPLTHLQHEMFLFGGPAHIPGLLAGLSGQRLGGHPMVTTMHHVVDPAMVDRRFTELHRTSAPAWAAKPAVAALQHSLGLLSDVIVHEAPFAAHVPGSQVIPHGVEVVDPLDRATSRRELALDDDRLTVLCFGYVAPYKGLESALQAARLAGRDVELVVAGGAHPRLAEDGDPYAEQLRRDFGGVARFTGYVPEGDVARWFSAADVALFCYPQAFAASGALALALAYGTPVLLSPGLGRAVGAPTDLISDMQPTALAARLADLARDPARRSAITASSTALVADRTWPAVARRHLDIYQEASHDPRSARRRVRAS